MPKESKILTGMRQAVEYVKSNSTNANEVTFKWARPGIGKMIRVTKTNVEKKQQTKK